MSKILILGAGSIGTAFAIPCIDRNHEVKIIGTHLEDDFIDNFKKNNNFHSTLNFKLNNNINILKYNNLSDALKIKQDLIVIAVTSKGIEWAANQLNKFKEKLKLTPILMLTKGLNVHNEKYELLNKKLERILNLKGFEKTNISVVGGPCIAKNLVKKTNSSVVFANQNINTVEWLKNIISTDYYHIEISTDVIGVEVCAAIKNIFSMIIGASKKLYSNDNNMDENNYLNASAALFSQSVYEMGLFVNLVKGRSETVYGLAGIGDLYVSAMGGRNSKMGEYIGQGYSYLEIKENKMLNVTVEGAELIFEIGDKIKKDFTSKEMPLMINMINTILNNKELIINWDNFKK